MRYGVSSAVVLVAVAFLGGCASRPSVVAKAPSASPHFSVAMDEETQRALLGEDEPVAVSTTTVTSAVLEAPLAKESSQAAAPLPEDRGSLSSPDVLRTWGSDVEGIPTAREE